MLRVAGDLIFSISICVRLNRMVFFSQSVADFYVKWCARWVPLCETAHGCALNVACVGIMPQCQSREELIVSRILVSVFIIILIIIM